MGHSQQHTERRFYWFEAEELSALLDALGETAVDSRGAKLADEVGRELIVRCRGGGDEALDAVYNGTYPVDTSELEVQTEETTDG